MKDSYFRISFTLSLIISILSASQQVSFIFFTSSYVFKYYNYGSFFHIKFMNKCTSEDQIFFIFIIFKQEQLLLGIYNKVMNRKILFFISPFIFHFASFSQETNILPNTYYLKMTGYPVVLRMARGLWMFLKMVLQEKFLPYILPFLLLYKNKN